MKETRFSNTGEKRGRAELRAFTLMELLTVIVIIAILAVLSIQSFAYLRERARLLNCTNNLTSLYAAASGYVTDNKSWPQIDTSDVHSANYVQSWLDALRPYHISAVNFICPSVQSLLSNPDYLTGDNRRTDYFPTPFDANPASPGRYSGQPWFIERADVHGDGNLMIFANGQVKSLGAVKRDATTQAPQ